jgi:DNA-directed RNA polymerase subunit RPC12/RpoP
MIVFPCQVCKTPLSAEEGQVGQLVRCPTCLTALRVPANGARETALAGVGAASSGFESTSIGSPPSHLPRGGSGAFPGVRPTGKRYGFNCAYCSSKLEATESMAAQEGQCPTCGNNITIPILDRYGRLIDPKTRQIIKQDPHPVHAYAAAGDRAPRIIRSDDGKQQIQCARCRALTDITANNCKSCGIPFTMEGTTIEATGSSNGFCVASLVLGIIGVPACVTWVVPILAIVFGIVGFVQTNQPGSEAGGKGMAIAGIVLGGVGLFIALIVMM